MAPIPHSYLYRLSMPCNNINEFILGCLDDYTFHISQESFSTNSEPLYLHTRSLINHIQYDKEYDQDKNKEITLYNLMMIHYNAKYLLPYPPNIVKITDHISRIRELYDTGYVDIKKNRKKIKIFLQKKTCDTLFENLPFEIKMHIFKYVCE